MNSINQLQSPSALSQLLGFQQSTLTATAQSTPANSSQTSGLDSLSISSAALQANDPQGAPSQAQGAAAQNGQGSSSQNPLSALASALQSGNLAAAQQAFSQVRQTQGHYHHHHHGSRSGSSTTATAPAEAATSNASSGNIIINISGGNNIIA
jgi:hypothetical protein